MINPSAATLYLLLQRLSEVAPDATEASNSFNCNFSEQLTLIY